ncbi:hypothetical protein IWQ56_005189 [Coemansia nantahalensis]|uniref:Uncharacterized protein n=2 Tax=Coemansia TaxID=4863 RepID=A0ACC1LGL3_9FUNG|nr:hypothetical protein IWQ56_005189 [Coemansia nantahalensis]KAJ2767208.1 hypothetical protein IWQ57_004045 [Coemansia nantahalensis]KAJ2807807.1 hypothetical protein H4R21_000335 [Coemansia helicoidea]
MQVFAILAAAAAVTVAQQISSDGGFTGSQGSAAISNPNINNGQQFQNSLVDTSDKGGNFFHDLAGNTFTSSLSNMGLMDNNMINPSRTGVMGNTGATANGADNHIGDVVGAGFWRRDAVFNNFGAYPGWGHHSVGAVAWNYPAVPVMAAPVYGYPVAQPVRVAAPVAHAAFPVAGHVNHNVQDASIIQNQA